MISFEILASFYAGALRREMSCFALSAAADTVLAVLKSP